MVQFVNCSSSESKCQTENYFTVFGGTTGVCNATSGLCICPAGYDGIDVLTTTNDCHVSHEIRRIILSVGLAVSIFVGVFILLGFIALMFRWGVVKLNWIEYDEDDGVMVNSDENEISEENDPEDGDQTTPPGRLGEKRNCCLTQQTKALL